jgi:chromosome segregation ATPase
MEIGEVLEKFKPLLAILSLVGRTEEILQMAAEAEIKAKAHAQEIEAQKKCLSEIQRVLVETETVNRQVSKEMAETRLELERARQEGKDLQRKISELKGAKTALKQDIEQQKILLTKLQKRANP